MITLNFDVNDQTLTRQDENTVAANSRLVHTCEFTFSSEWDGRGKVATFKKRDLMLSVIVDDTTSSCVLPPEILQSENKIDVFELSICGADGNSTITSTIVRVPILAGTWDPFTEEITPTLFEQIMQKIDEIEKGEVSPELIYEAVTEYMEAHPLEPIIADDVAAYFAAHAEELKGDKGDTGATPTISAAATVDNTTGTPTVNVSKTGTDAAPEFTFAFTGLKGPKGDPGTPGASYDDTEIRAEINDVWKVQGELGAKNLIPFPYNDTHKEYAGITYDAQDDGSILINGTSTAYSFFLVQRAANFLPHGDYVISFNRDDVPSNTNLSLSIGITNKTNYQYATKAYVDKTLIGKQFTIDETWDDYFIEIRISINSSGISFEDFTMYPMIRLASDTDSTWQPYALTNKQISDYIKNNIMQTSIYDPNNVVANASGITNYVGNKIENEIIAIDGIDTTTHFYPLTLDIEQKYIQNMTVNNGKWVYESIGKGASLSVYEGEVYQITGTISYLSALYGLYDANGHVMVLYPHDVTTTPPVRETVTIIIPQGAAELRVSSIGASSLDVSKQTNIFKVQFPNILDGKKWAACGDSFTAGDFTNYVDSEGHSGRESDAYDTASGHYKTYPWWIGNRNNMDIQWLAAGGADFTNIEGSANPFSANNSYINYTQIANDCDYITLMYGLNETGLTNAEIGTKTDTTNSTLWGAYNVVLTSILTANPHVKIGIIISDAWMTQTYHDALIEIANYWGIPYLDLKNGEEVPLMIGGRFRETSPTAVDARNTAFKCSASDAHPNVEGHKYRSTVIEQFLRSL